MCVSSRYLLGREGACEYRRTLVNGRWAGTRTGKMKGGWEEADLGTSLNWREEREAWLRVMGWELLRNFFWTGSTQEIFTVMLKGGIHRTRSYFMRKYTCSGSISFLQWPHKSSRSSVCSFSAVRLSNWSLLHPFHFPKSAVTTQTCALVTAVRESGDPCCVWHGQDYCLPKIFPFFPTSLFLRTQRN